MSDYDINQEGLRDVLSDYEWERGQQLGRMESSVQWIRLRSDWPRDPSNVPRSLIFGQMVHLALVYGNLSSYLSDLYYDADFLQRVKEGDSFVYGVRETGTFIGEGGEDVVEMARQHNDIVWRIHVYCNAKGYWIMEWQDVS